MKALKSKLATKLLADPAMGDTFRHFLINKKNTEEYGIVPSKNEFNSSGKDKNLKFSAKVVSKAGKSL